MKNNKRIAILVIAVLLAFSIFLFSKGMKGERNEELSDISQEKQGELFQLSQVIIEDFVAGGTQNIDKYMTQGLKDAFDQDTRNQMDKEIENKGNIKEFLEGDAAGYTQPDTKIEYYLVDQKVEFDKNPMNSKAVFRLVFNMDNELEGFSIR